MFIAYNAAHERIIIDHADSSEKYYCPVCGEELCVKNKGSIKKHHFAHINKCTDTWTNDMSEWHINWQERFPEECREVVVESDGIRHRADVLIGNTVIEFQHSKISIEEFKERNSFYTGLGYTVVWVFDMIKEYENGKITRSVRYEDSYTWKYHWHTFDEYAIHYKNEQNVKLFFQMCENTYKLSYEDDYELYHIRYMSKWPSFTIHIDNETFYFLPDIDKVFSLMTNAIIKRRYPVSVIQDQLHFDHDYLVPCYKNTGYVEFDSCIGCPYTTSSIGRNIPEPLRESYKESWLGCIFRFADILDGWDIKTDRVVDIALTEEGLVSYIKVYKDGEIIEKQYNNDLKIEINSWGSLPDYLEPHDF